MAMVRRFEDLQCWKRARELNRQVYQASGAGSFAKDFELRGQIRSASVSVMANIAEGFGRGGRKEFIQFLSIAKGSLDELKSHLYAAVDALHMGSAAFDELYALADDVGRLIYGMMNYLQTSTVSGPKYLNSDHRTRTD